MNYTLKGHEVIQIVHENKGELPKTERDPMDAKILKIRTLFWEYYDKYKRLPNIEEYNQYQRINLPINKVLMDLGTDYFTFIEKYLGIKQTKKGAYPIQSVKREFFNWLADYESRHKRTPSYQESLIELSKLSQGVMGIKEKQEIFKELKLYSYKSKKENNHVRKHREVIRKRIEGKEKLLKELETIIEAEINSDKQEAFIMFPINNKRYVVKFSK